MKKKRKNHVGQEKSCWMKIWLQTIFHPTFSGSSNIVFMFTQLNNILFLNVISNDRTSNFEWLNKTKTLCKIMTIYKSNTLNRNELEQQQRRLWHLSKLQEQNLEVYKDVTEEVEIAEKEKKSRLKKVYKENRKKERLKKLIHSRVLPRRCLSSSESTSSDSVTGKNISTAITDLT